MCSLRASFLYLPLPGPLPSPLPRGESGRIGHAPQRTNRLITRPERKHLIHSKTLSLSPRGRGPGRRGTNSRRTQRTPQKKQNFSNHRSILAATTVRLIMLNHQVDFWYLLDFTIGELQPQICQLSQSPQITGFARFDTCFYATSGLISSKKSCLTSDAISIPCCVH